MIKSVEIEGDLVVLHSHMFQGGGWYIEVDSNNNEIRLKEIPIYGGEPCLIGKYNTLKEALLEGKKLT